MKYNWKEIKQYIMDNVGKYTRSEICEKVNIPYKILTRHIQRSCPELENYIKREFREYDWTEIDRFIIDNAGKYTRSEICEKVNIPYKTLAQHILRNCPELEKYIINEHKKDKYDWTEIDRFIIDNAGKYTRSEICEKVNIPYKTLIGHIKRCYPEFEIEKYIKREVNKYDWKEIEQFIMDNAGKYTKSEICKKFNIGYTSILNNHIHNNCPELLNCFVCNWI